MSMVGKGCWVTNLSDSKGVRICVEAAAAAAIRKYSNSPASQKTCPPMILPPDCGGMIGCIVANSMELASAVDGDAVVQLGHSPP
eukprot:scaffold102431_cov21-Prasinocladus_malaysianus.AAC.1